MEMDFPVSHRWLLVAGLILAGCNKANSEGETALAPQPAEFAKTRPVPAERPAVGASPDAATSVVPVSYTEPIAQLETTWITEDYLAALLVHPRQLLEKQQLHGESRAWLDAAAADLGVSLPELEQVCFLLGPPEASAQTPAAPFATAWIFRFATPAGQQRMLRRFLGEQHRQQATSDGLTYYKDPAAPIALGAPDETTVVLAPERILKKSLLATPPRSPLLTQLAAVEGRPDIVGAVDAAPLRALLRHAATAGGAPTPPWLRPVTDVARQLKQGTLTVDFARAPLARLILEAEDSQAATRLEELARGYRAGASLLLGATKAQWVRGDDGKDFAPLFDLLIQTLNSVETTRDVRRVVIQAPAPAELSTLPRVVESAFIAASRGAARQERVHKLQMIGLAMHNHHVVKGRFPAGATYDAKGQPLLSWRVHLLPFLGEEELYAEFRLDEPWNSPHNRSLIPKIPPVYQSPNVQVDGQTQFTTFVGEGTPFSSRQGPALRDFTDGPSETILVVECGPDRAVFWTQPDHLPLDPANPVAELGAVENAGLLALFGDGRVEIIKSHIQPVAFSAILTHAGGEGRPSNP